MCDDRYIDNCRNTHKDSYRDKYRDKYRDDSLNSDRGRSREKHCLHKSRKDNNFGGNDSELERLYKVLQPLSPDKVVAIRLMLTSSENFDNILDNIHSQADVDCLIPERIVYAKSQEAENRTREIHYDDSTNSQNNVNYVTYEPIDSFKDEKDLSNRDLVEKDTCFMQDSQEDFNFIGEDDVQNEFIDREVDNFL